MFIRTGLAVSIASFGIVTTAFAQQTFAPNPFTDVPKTSIYYEAIENLRVNNVLKGYDDGTFRPTARVNRAEFVKLITNPYILDTGRLNECLTKQLPPNAKTIFFSDVPRDSWYGPELCFSKIKGLVSGYPDGTFQPGNYISFVEAAKIIVSTFALQTTTDETDQKWYKPYVQKLDELNAIPTSISRFAQPMTRGQVAEILFRLKTNRTNKASKTYGDLR
jgi:hypothetical protein